MEDITVWLIAQIIIAAFAAIGAGTVINLGLEWYEDDRQALESEDRAREQRLKHVVRSRAGRGDSVPARPEIRREPRPPLTLLIQSDKIAEAGE